MSGWRASGAAAVVAGLLLAAPAGAETKPSAAPPKPAADIDKNRAPAKGKGWFSLPEKDDEVLVRSKRKGAQ